uniref:Uncharacterized protein n=1 Tax=Caenorhabditis japonica TaxID=281687 RepID=A0A8R1DV15_CAEJA
MICRICDWLIDEKFAMFSTLISIFLFAPFILINCSSRSKEDSEASDSDGRKKSKKNKTGRSKNRGKNASNSSLSRSITRESKRSRKWTSKLKKNFKKQKKTARSEPEYKPPPQNERPRHPGFEIQLEPNDDLNTVRQIENFRDAQGF